MYSVIIQVKVVLNKKLLSVTDINFFNNLSGSFFQGQVALKMTSARWLKCY